MNISKREIVVNGFGLSVYVFKNIPSNQINDLTQALAEQIWEAKSAILSLTIWTDKSLHKNYQNFFEEAFDEANWPILWINRPQGKPELTGYLVAVSGTTVKTMVSDHFTSKTFESPLGRLIFGGNFFTGKERKSDKQTELLFESINKALFFSGMNHEQLIQINSIVPPEFITDSLLAKTRAIKLSANIIEGGNDTRFDAAIIGLQPASGTEIRMDTEQVPEAIIETWFAQNPETKWLIITIRPGICPTDDMNKNIEAIFNRIDVHLLNHNLKWKDLIIGKTYTGQKEMYMAIKNVAKENQLPISQFIMIENNNNEGKSGDLLQIHFMCGTKKID